MINLKQVDCLALNVIKGKARTRGGGRDKLI